MFAFAQSMIPTKGETPFSYWISLSPVAPVFGVPYRFTPILSGAPRPDAPVPTSQEEVDDAVVVTEEPASSHSAQSVDDLTVLKGIGPKLAAELSSLGLTSFAQLAAMTAADLEALDAKLSGPKGRPHRNDWIGQAKARLA